MDQTDYRGLEKIEGIMRRALTFERDDIDADERTVELSFSSEEPVERFFGMEVLDHKKKSVRLERLNSGAPVLVDHFSDQVGVVEKAWIDSKAKKGRALLRFSKSDLGSTVFQDMQDNIRRNISVGYRVHDLKLDKEEGGVPTFRAVSWEPMEISVVSVPADIQVGLGRSESIKEAVGGWRKEDDTPIIVHINQKEAPMTEANTKNQEVSQGVAPALVPSPAAAMSVDQARNEAVREEQNRAKELLALGEQHNCREDAAKYVAEGNSVDDLKRFILERYKKIEPVQQVDPQIGLTKKERKEFSFVRMINALAGKDWNLAPFEHECSRATAKRIGRDPAGMFVPEDVLLNPLDEHVDSRSQMDLIMRSLNALLQKRELDVATATAAGHLVGTNLMSQNFIELLRNFQVVRAVGAQILSGLVGDVTFPRQDSGASSGWVAESGNVANSELTVDLPSLTPHSTGAYSDMTRKLLLQSSPSIEALVRADLAMAVALDIDSQALNGTGAGAVPLGIRATTGIGDVDHGTNGSAETWGTIVEYESDVSIANAAVGDMWYVMTPQAFGKAKTTPKESGQAVYLGSGRIAPLGQGEVNGYPVAVTNQLPSNLTKGSGTNLSATVFGNFRDLLIGEWSGLDVLADPYTLGLDGGLRVIVHQDVDFLVRHPGSFAASDDVITTP